MQDDSRWRYELVFWILAAIFWGSMVMLNILGTTRFLDFSLEFESFKIPFEVAVGVLPYPITFLCTDLISELYGKRRANAVVWIGLLLNLWLFFILWLGGALPGNEGKAFMAVREMAFPMIFASMVSYLAAQLIDVNVFHWLKNKTKGKHLWLRNNVSTLTSQLVDTVLVITLAHAIVGLDVLPGRSDTEQLMIYIASGYVFKLVVALLDTGPMYLLTKHLGRYIKD